MDRFCRAWSTPDSTFGNLAILGFLLVQWLDGVYTYLGIYTWGPHIEANPLVSSAVAVAGPGVALYATKLFAVACGMVLHLRRIHRMVALLTLFYLVAAILPWTALFLTN
jgi:hypothetical protein